MKRDEVMAMTYDQLRIKAAELMGAEWFVCPSSMNAGRFLAFGRAVGWRKASGDEHEQCTGSFKIPDYPNDIAAAMQLEEIAHSHGLLFDVGRVHDEPTKWHADFFLLNPVCPGNETYNELSPFYRMLGGSPAQAITRAFILATESTDD